MIHIKNVTALLGDKQEIILPSKEEKIIDGSSLIAIPALIDPHVHFRVPGQEHKEDWKTASMAAVRSGVTTVLDMPNNVPSCCSLERLIAKKKLIDSQLKSVGIPLRYGLYLGADKHHFDEIEKAKHVAIAIKIFMGCSTGDLLIDSKEDLNTVFKRAKDANLLVAVHAEDEEILHQKKKEFKGILEPSVHSKIRTKEAAIKATALAIELAAKYQTPLYILHTSTKKELELIAQAKKEGVPVYCEVTTHHLFFTVDHYEKHGTLVQMNPPLRDEEDREALWEGLRNGIVDTIGTDHAPHTLLEKQQPYGQAPSGIPGVETLLPLMLDAVNQKKLTLERLVELTRYNPEKIFKLPPNNDLVLIDLNREDTVKRESLYSKCGWSPYCGMNLKGWPIYTILNNHLISCRINP